MDEMIWQPIMLISAQAVKCDCGALAICLEIDENGDLLDYVPLCQRCFERDDEEEA